MCFEARFSQNFNQATHIYIELEFIILYYEN